MLDAVLRDDVTGRVACETLITTGLVVVAGEITTETYVDVARIVRDEDHRDRLHALRVGLRRHDLRRRRRDRRAVAGHRPGRRLLVRGAARPGRRRPARQARRGRPGDDVRLRDARDGRADAAADHARAQDLQAARRGAQGRRPAVPAAGRQGAGDGALRGRRARRAEARRDRADPRLDAALGRDQLRGPDQAGHHRAGAAADPALGPLRGEAPPRRPRLRLREPDRQVRARRADGRHGADRAQDHRRHLRRRCAPRRRRLLGQGSDEGRPLRRLRRALRGEEPRRRPISPTAPR